MAISANSVVKKCVTCEYWGGVRAVSPTGREVKYKLRATDGDAGICGNKSSMKKGRPVRGGDSACSRWVKWNRLK